MKPFRYDYAVIGGDLRQVYLTAELSEKNQSICHFALCQSIKPFSSSDNIKASSSLEAAVGNAKHIICPIPFSKDGISLNQSSSKKSITIKQILSLLKPGQYFFAGNISDDFCHLAREKSVLVFDLMQDPALSYFNTIATSEGVICEAIKESPINLHKSRCMVLGYGKCGRTLTDGLKNMACHVTVTASVAAELAMASVAADDTLDVKRLSSHIGKYDFIFNTIPAVILTKEILLHAKSSVIILDIASSPGGVDFHAAKELSLYAKSCPGLPGRYAPLSSARAIIKSIKNAETPVGIP